jgi:hypothetical protein
MTEPGENPEPLWWDHAFRYSEIAAGRNYVCFTIVNVQKRHVFDVNSDDEGYCSGFDEETTPEYVQSTTITIKRYVPLSEVEEEANSANDDIREWKGKSRCRGSCACNMWDTFKVIKISLVKIK